MKKDATHEEDKSSEPKSDEDEDLVEVTDFDWLDYFERTNEKITDKKRLFSGVPDSSFQHVERSLDAGVKEGFVVEYQWDQTNNVCWLAIVENVHGPLLVLTYVGEDHPAKIWHDLSQKGLFPLGWCQQNKFQLEPPRHIRTTCLDWETLALQYLEDISYDTISMYHIDGEGVTPAERLKIGSILELQDFENPYHFWPVKISANLGCLLTLEYVRFEGQTESLFYLSNRLFKKGHASATKGSSYAIPSKLEPFQTKATDKKMEISKVEGVSVPDDLISNELPDKHKFEAGFHLEMIHPLTSKSIDRYVVESVIDDLYFVVQSVTEPNVKKVVSMLDTTIFPCGTSKSLRSVSSTINDANSRGKVVQKRNFPDFQSAEELGFVDRQKLVVHDDDMFRTATIVETKNHLLVLELDGSKTKHVFKSAHSMDIFPLSWCISNGVPLNIPKTFLPAEIALPEIEEKPKVPEIVEKIEDKEMSSWCDTVYINFKCYSASFLTKAKVAKLPRTIGPGPVQLVMRSVLNFLIRSSFKSKSILRRLEVKSEDAPKKNFVKEEFKGKSIVQTVKGDVEVPTKRDQVDQFLKDVCQKANACPNLVSTTLYANACPVDCSNQPKAYFEPDKKIRTKEKAKSGQPKKRKNQDLVLAEKGLNNKSDSSIQNDESDTNNEISRTNSPKNFRKRSRLSRGAKVNQAPFFNTSNPIVEKRNLSKRNLENIEIIRKKRRETSSSDESSESSGPVVPPFTQPPPSRPVKLATNPEFWTPLDTAKFLAQTTDCHQLAPLMVEEAIDGQAFLLLNYLSVRDHWRLEESVAIKLCQHIESVKLAHLTQF